jgi:hypothetical protein
VAKTNITLKIDTNLLREIKILAAKEGTSITALMAALMEERVKKGSDYERLKRRALARLHKGLDLGGRPSSREDIYER